MLFEQPRELQTLSTAPASDAASPYDYPGVPMVDVPVADPNEPLARVISAAHTSAQYDGISAGRINAVTDAYDARNAAIAQATGIKLNNPFRDGYYDEAFQRWRDENQYVPPHPPDISDVQAQKSRLIEIQHGIWQEKLSQAAAANPLYADVIGADRPITQDAIGLANKAQTDLAAAQEAYGGGVPSFLASLAGGLVGGMRDPVNVAALAFGGGELKAASVVGQVFEGAIRQGFVNAGVQLMAEPQVQAWRAERGAEHGFVPAAEDVGLAALFGAIPGAGFAGARALRRGGRSPRAISADIGQAAAGDVEAASRVAEHLPSEIAPDLHAAIDSARLDREAMPALPDGLAAEDAADAMRGALRHAEDPSQPLGENVPDVPPGTTDTLARHVLDGMIVHPDEFSARVEERARAIEPAGYAAADRIDADLAAQRNRLQENLDLQRRLTEEPPQISGERQAALEAELASFTGKRRSSPRAKALRAELERVQAEAAQVTADPMQRAQREETNLRLSINDLAQERARQGPKLFAAMRQAEAEAAALGFERGAPPDPATAVEAIRSSEAAKASALASDDPNVRQVGRIASLDDDAFGLVADGRADAATAAAVGARVGRGEQGSVLAEAMRDRPQSPQEAAAAVSDIMEHRAVPAAQAAALAAEGEPLREVPTALLSRETNAERAVHVAELEKSMVEPPSSPGGEGDVFGLVPIGEREDGLGMRLVTRDELLAEPPREHALADIVEACKT